MPLELPAGAVLDRIEGFVELLRAEDVDVSVDETVSAVEALECLELEDLDGLYWGLRMCLVSSHSSIAVFDRLFWAYWRPSDPRVDQPPLADDSDEEPPLPSPGAESSAEDEADGTDADGDEDEPALFAAYSAVERLREKNFADFDEDDYRRLSEILEHLDLSNPRRLSRRRRPARRGMLDTRRTMISSFQTGGYPIRTSHRSRSFTPRSIVFVCDVSGSMQTYAMPMLMFAHAMARRRRAVSTFAFATRLHVIERELDRRDPREAMVAAVDRLADWSGGTRVGDCLEALNLDYSARLRGAVVVIASDGWDLGDVDQLRRQMDRLRLLAHEVIWLNPNLQDKDFEPLTKGMSNALPYVDQLLSCHKYANLEALIARLAASAAR